MFDDRPICVHAGFCGNKVTNVWKMAAETSDSRIRAEAIAMIERCPSGALTYAVDGETIEPDLPVEVAVIPDGPLWVSGGLEVTRSDGSVLETRNRVTLCRCGQSASKPLCDGSHKRLASPDNRSLQSVLEPRCSQSTASGGPMLRFRQRIMIDCRPNARRLSNLAPLYIDQVDQILRTRICKCLGDQRGSDMRNLFPGPERTPTAVLREGTVIDRS